MAEPARERTEWSDGLYPDVPYALYASWPARRASVLRHAARSASHLRLAALRVEEDSTRDTDLGVGVHCALLEPHRFEARYVPGLRRGKRSRVDQAAHAAFALEQAGAGREVLPDADYERALRIREKVHSIEWCRALLGGPGLIELSALWTDDTSGVRCKARIDWAKLEYLAPGWSSPAPVLVDLKTSKDVSEDGWRRACESYGYPLQARMQLEGMAAHDSSWLDAGTLEPRPEQYLWLVLEKDPPFEPSLHMPSSDLLDAAGLQLRAALLLWATSEREGRWPGYPGEARPVELTPWARRRMLGDSGERGGRRRAPRGERTRHTERDVLDGASAEGDGADLF